jgi:inner membrane protein
MIQNMVRERENTQKEAISEVSSRWAQQQTICGPFISVPFVKYVKSHDGNVEKLIEVRDHLHILPQILNIECSIEPERRYRGIYEVVVYHSKQHISGSFSDIPLKELDIPAENIHFEKAFITVGINDLRGIGEPAILEWNNEHVSFDPGVLSNDIVQSGINAPVELNPAGGTVYNFSFSLDLKGSQNLFYTPLGKITRISVTSPWSDPGFTGAFLPDSRIVSDTGFVAGWNVLHLNRNYPQFWTGSNYTVNSSAFGIDLLLPVDNYQKTYRSIRYAILFIGLTFLVFFFIEVLNKIFIHPIQYVLVGIALVVFYSLLLSISEHLMFNPAFIISAFATLLLIAGYIKAILKSTTFTLLISSILFILYTFIFVIIQLQDYALLIGSIGIFIILALVMYFSRKIDWYALNSDNKK